MAGDNDAGVSPANPHLGSSSYKKKRVTPDDGLAADGDRRNVKRPHQQGRAEAIGAISAVKESVRNEITKIYSSYGTLLQRSSLQSLPPGITGPDQEAFQELLNAAQGTLAAKRLAARLAPRFLNRFPHQVDATAAMLMALYQEKQHKDAETEKIVQSTREDALRGLGSVLESAMKLADKAVPTILRVVDFLLRQLHVHSNAPSGPSSPTFGGDADFFCDAIDDLLVVQRLLEKAYRCFPRVVLSCCLQSFRGNDKVLYQAANIFLERHLLHEPVSSTEASGKAANSQAAGSVQGAGATTGPAAAGSGATAKQQPAKPKCLAAEVLAQLPDTQAWLRHAIVSISKDKQILAAKEIHVHIDKLLKLIPLPARAPPPPSPPPPPPISDVKASKPSSTSRAAPDAMHADRTHGNGGVPGPPPWPAHESGAGSGSLPPGYAPRGVTGGLNGPSAAAAAAGMEPAAAAPQQQAAGTMPAGPLNFTGRGGPLCRADACLYLVGLPPALSELALRQELMRHSVVETVHMSGNPCAPGLGMGEAYVVFKSVTDAAICYEVLVGTYPFGGSRPLHAEFCPSLPPDCPSRQRHPSAAPSPFVWVLGQSPEAVAVALQEAGLPVPEPMVRVAGRGPGLLLDISRQPDIVERCLEVLITRLAPHLLPQYQQQLHQMYNRQQQQQQGPSQQQQQAGQQAGSLYRSHSQPAPAAGTAGGAGAGAGGPAGGAMLGQQHSSPAPSAALEGFKTLWIGQLHDSVREEEILNAFKWFGEVVSYRFLRSSHCAFIDFQHPMAAAEARKAMNGKRFGPQVIRVEFKTEDRRVSGRPPAMTPIQPSPAGLPPRAPGSTPGPAAASPWESAQVAAAAAAGGLGSVLRAGSVGASSPLTPAGSLASGLLGHSLVRRADSWNQPGGPLGLSPAASASPAHQLRMQSSAGGQQDGGMQHMPPHLGAPGPPGSGSSSMPTPLPSASSVQLSWQGSLAKSGGTLCMLSCCREPISPQSGTAPEPQGWPSVLDVRLRVDLQYVVHQLYANTPLNQRAVRRLEVVSDERGKLREFVQYLAEKDRAGVIKLDPVQGSAAARTLYIIPPSQPVCAALSVQWPLPQAQALLAVVVPAASK